MKIFNLLSLFCILTYFSGWTSGDISQQCPARRTDSFLRKYAFKNLNNFKTGAIYEGTTPANLTGITVSAVRLRTGSLRINGVSFKEFQIPAGVYTTPYVERLVLMYENLGNWSSHFYGLDGYINLTPVLGILAYNDSNLSVARLPELDLQASEKPISVKFHDLKSAPKGSKPMCVRFDLQCLVSFNKVILGNSCLTYGQGHFLIVAETVTPTENQTKPLQNVGKKEMNVSLELIVVGSAVGGLVLVMLLSFIVLCSFRSDREEKTGIMKKVTEVGESVKMKCIKISKRGNGANDRTEPTLEIIHCS